MSTLVLARVRAASVLALFALALAFAALAPLRTRDSVEAPGAFVEALRAKADLLRPGDRVLLHPPWRDDALDAVEASGLLPPGVAATLALSPNHGEPLGRVLLLADPALPLPRARQRVLAGVEVERIAGLDVALLDDGGASERGTPGRLDERIFSAKVIVDGPGSQRTECRWSPLAKKHECPGRPSWLYVGPTQMTSGGKTRDCLWGHPLTGARVVTRFPKVPLGDSLALTHALSDPAAQNPRGAPVTAVVRLDGEELGRAVKANRPGFETRVFRLPKGKRVGDVEVEVTTPNDGQRHYCFSLRMEGGGS